MRTELDRRRSRVGLTLIQLLVVIAVFAVLMGLILPAVQMVRAFVDRAHCANNLRQIGIAYHLFLDEHGGKASAFSANSAWAKQLKCYLENREDIFLCASDTEEANRLHHYTLDGRRRLSDQGFFFLAEHDGVARRWNIETGELRESAQIQSWVAEGDARLHRRAGERLVMYFAVPDVKTSYGINSHAGRFVLANDSQKVLAVEYHMPVVYFERVFLGGAGGGVWGTAGDDWQSAAAPRHRGTFNALFLDGSVRAFGASDFDPRDDNNLDVFWVPYCMQK